MRGSRAKLVVVGGASSTFIPPLLRELTDSATLRGGTVCFVDVDETRVQEVAELARAVLRGKGLDITVKGTTARREALQGADFVLVSISVGGMSAWETDIEIPARYGIFMEVADTVGPGGILRAFRHAPLVAEVGRDIAELAPGAWVFNYTNPVTVNTMAMLRAGGIRCASLCTCVCDLDASVLASLAGVEPEQLVLPPVVGGINHCAGILDLRLRSGESALQRILERLDNEVMGFLADSYDVLPYCWEHWMEFHPELLRLDEPYGGRAQGLRMKHGLRIRDMQEQRQRVARWRSILQRAARTQGEAPGQQLTLADLPPEDPGKPVEVLRLIDAMVQDRKQAFVVNVANEGVIENLPSWAVVEVSALADGYGLRPMRVGRLPELLAAKLAQYSAGQALTLEAALTGSWELAVRAFRQDPVVAAHLEPGEARELLREMVEANRAYLPQFQHE